MRQRQQTRRAARPGRPGRLPGSVRRGWIAGGAVALALTAGAHRGETYRLLDNGATDNIVASESAVRWTSGAWAPGATLSWQITDAPEWARIFGSRRQFESAVDEALSHWSGIETADIRWSVSGTPGTATSTWTRDSSNQVFLHSDGAEWEDGAGLWFERDASAREWQISECDVGAPQRWLRDLGSRDPTSAAESAGFELRGWFAYCLGLDTSARMPYESVLRSFDTDDPSALVSHFSPWQREDDRNVGASLLRPRQGWLATVGAVAGTLVADGEPVSYAHVWAFRTNGGSDVRHPVGAFTNRAGAFSVEGLVPGEYVLWAHPVDSYVHRLAGLGGTKDVRDAILAQPVRVTAGGVARGLRITMQENR